MTILHSTFYPNEQSQRTVVLIHGLFGSLDNLSMIRRETQQYMNVLSIDLPEHGKSEWLNTINVVHWASLVKDCIASYKIDQCAILGHSLGGKVAMAVALTSPALVKSLLVLDIAPVRYSGHRHTKVFAGLKAVNLTTITSRKDAELSMATHIDDIGTRMFLLKSLYQDDNKQYQWRFNLPVLEQQYAELTDWPLTSNTYSGDTLFIKGKQSDYILPEHEASIRSFFPNASAKIVDAGHWLHAEKTTIVNRLITKHLHKSYSIK